jgi:hypothetical protein
MSVGDRDAAVQDGRRREDEGEGDGPRVKATAARGHPRRRLREMPIDGTGGAGQLRRVLSVDSAGICASELGCEASGCIAIGGVDSAPSSTLEQRCGWGTLAAAASATSPDRNRQQEAERCSEAAGFLVARGVHPPSLSSGARFCIERELGRCKTPSRWTVASGAGFLGPDLMRKPHKVGYNI